MRANPLQFNSHSTIDICLFHRPRGTYSDMGNPGSTDVQVTDGKIAAYKR